MRWLPSDTVRRAGLGLIVLIFACGLLQVFVLRFNAGDVHPPYSSQRLDPLGTAALYESLKQLPGSRVSRNFDPPHRTRYDAAATLIYLGASEYWGPACARPEALFERLERNGGRLLIAFSPQHGLQENSSAKGCRTRAAAASGGEARRDPPQPQEDGGLRKPAAPRPPPSDLARLFEERCGLRILRASPASSKDAPVLGQARSAVAWLPAAVPWHGGRHFEILDPAWTVLYTQNGHPVMVERGLGAKGRIVLAADAYLFSNEALSRHRQSALIAYAVGPAGDLVFDETHLGLIDQPTIARLIRMQGLHGFLIAAAGLALLMAWRSAAPLTPPVGARAAAEVAGEAQDSFQGWVSLLRRNIGRREILGVCLEEWSKPAAAAAGGRKPPEPAALAEIKRAALAAADPVEGYRRVCRMLSERTSHE